jgi:hypothetical protein
LIDGLLAGADGKDANVHRERAVLQAGTRTVRAPSDPIGASTGRCGGRFAISRVMGTGGGRLVWSTVAQCVLLAACQGFVGDPGESELGGPADVRCGTVSDQPLRRLSHEQYANVLGDLFGDSLGPALGAVSIFPATVVETGFTSDADANVVSTAESQRIEDNAERLATHLLENAGTAIPELMPCAAAGTDAAIEGCIDEFIRDFGLRAFRRPLRDQERAIARGLFDEVRASQGARTGWAAVMQFFLQAPALLYRTEPGQGGSSPLVALSDYEMASRLSFFFWNSMPDDELFDAAARGELRTRAEVEAQARRMLDDPRTLETIGAFHRDWLRVYRLTDAPKEDPEFTDEVRAAMLAEPRAFVQWVFDQGGSFESLMSAGSYPIAPELAGIYGGTSDDRSGIFTLASVAASHAREGSSNPIERGAFFRRDVLCTPIPALPGDIDIASPLESTAGRPTARERLAPLLERSDCRACHTLMNPIGMAFENYDAVGRWRDTENGATIDASADVEVGDIRGHANGPAELMELVAASDVARDCYAQKWLHFVLGRALVPADECNLGSLEVAFDESGGDIRELLVATTQLDAFMYRAREVTP